MADPRKSLATNVPGDFFVDSTCINCDTCRQLAPDVFAEEGDLSCVRSQPASDTGVRDATRALLSCPTGSIGTRGTNMASAVMKDFPLMLEDDVYYCGFNSPKSYGGNSYFVQHAEGNWLIDSPKFIPQLVRRFHELGGVSHIFLTHRDDVAEAASYAKEFGAACIIHSRDKSAQPDAEKVISGDEDVRINNDFLIIPTPGHTAGHCVLLYKEKFLFTGDHLDWDRELQRLSCFPDHCWYDWEIQKESIAKLANYKFQWVLAAHGDRNKLAPGESKNQIESLSARIQ